MFFEIYADTTDQYRWRFKASNGKTIADSGESYWNRSDCQAGLNLVKQNAFSAPVR